MVLIVFKCILLSMIAVTIFTITTRREYISYQPIGENNQKNFTWIEEERERLKKEVDDVKTINEQIRKKLDVVESQVKVTERQTKRQSMIRTFCNKTQQRNETRQTKRSAYHLYDKTHGFVYCSIPKAACTNWKRIMLVLNGQLKNITEEKDKDKVHNYYLSKLNSLQETEYKHIKNTFYSFVFVRNPFERLVASYRNKLLDPNTDAFQKGYGALILRLSRKNLTEDEYKQGKNVTFREYVDWLVAFHKEYGSSGFDEHWQLMHKLSIPCHMKYNYIGKMETLYEDAEQILKELNLSSKIQFPVKLKDRYKIDSSQLMEEYFSSIPKETLEKLYEIYKDDFEAFGYEKPNHLLE